MENKISKLIELNSQKIGPKMIKREMKILNYDYLIIIPSFTIIFCCCIHNFITLSLAKLNKKIFINIQWNNILAAGITASPRHSTKCYSTTTTATYFYACLFHIYELFIAFPPLLLLLLELCFSPLSVLYTQIFLSGIKQEMKNYK